MSQDDPAPTRPKDGGRGRASRGNSTRKGGRRAEAKPEEDTAETTAETAVATLREVDEDDLEETHFVFVVDGRGRLVGRLPLIRLLLARPDTLRYRTGKFLRRHRLGVAAAAAILVLAFGFAAAMWVQAARISGAGRISGSRPGPAAAALNCGGPCAIRATTISPGFTRPR